MPSVKQYHRPSSMEQALNLLTQKGQSAAILAGGTSLVSKLSDEVTDIIDLQSLGLDQVELSGDRATFGAMTRLQDIVDNDALPAVVRRAAKNEGPNTLRNAATVGGVLVGGHSESEFCAAMLAFEALVSLQSAGESDQLPLEEFMASMAYSGLVTGVSFALGGEAGYERVARTPADSPIVAVIGRRNPEGEVRLAFCGLAEKPVLLSLSELQELVPPGNFRGSSTYRQAVATTLADRVIQALK